MQKLFSYMFMACLVVALQIAVFIYGWGLRPQSWWWIIGGGIFGTTALRSLFDKLEKEAK